MFNFFEHPWGLITVAIITLLVLLMVRSIFPEKCRWWQWLLPALLAVAAFGFDFLIETDLEKINAVINTAVKAVEEENPDAIEPIISDNYRDSYHKTKKNLMYLCRWRLSEPLIEKNIKRIVSIDISPPKATAIFTVRIVFDKRSYVYQSFKQIMLTKLKLDLQKERYRPTAGNSKSQLKIENRKSKINGWLISRAELLEIDMQPVTWQDIKQANW